MTDYISKKALINWLRMDGDVPNPRAIIRIINSGKFDAQPSNQQEPVIGLEPLKGRQSRVFEFLVSFIQKKGYSPSVREIGDAVELLSSSTVHGHLERLEAKGYIKRNAKRGVTIISKREAATNEVRGN